MERYGAVSLRMSLLFNVAQWIHGGLHSTIVQKRKILLVLFYLFILVVNSNNFTSYNNVYLLPSILT